MNEKELAEEIKEEVSKVIRQNLESLVGKPLEPAIDVNKIFNENNYKVEIHKKDPNVKEVEDLLGVKDESVSFTISYKPDHPVDFISIYDFVLKDKP